MKKMTLLVLIGMSLLSLPVQAQINLLHEFSGTAGDGAYPRGELLLSGTTFYGMTWIGGASGQGTIFKMQTDGSDFILLHEFVGGENDGAQPNGTLTLSGTTLYGMTAKGGDSDLGTIFKIETDGDGFSLLHEFAGGPADGACPLSNGCLVISGSTLFGMTIEGGSEELGTIFKIDSESSDFTLLHSFTHDDDNGSQPFGSLVLSGTTLYGMTVGGGASANGTIFKIETNGNDFTLIHEFAGGPDDGSDPEGALIISGSTLYGMTSHGGNNDRGTVFKISTDGSEFYLLHEFAGGVADGAYPRGALLLSGSTFYGMTGPDGVFSNLGTIFKLDISGSGFSLLHSFAGGNEDGEWPGASLIIVDTFLFGMTPGGGDSDMGVIFSLQIPSLTVISPNGGESFNGGESHSITWTSTGAILNVNILLSINNGSSWNPVATGTANDGTYLWTVPAISSTTCLIKICDAMDSSVTDVSDAVFTISAPAETISIPNVPSGPSYGLNSISYNFSTNGSTSSLGHSIQYKFDWNDGSDSGWLAVGTTSASHAWSANGTYNVRAMARCATDTSLESLWSEPRAILISETGTAGYYNSPASRLLFPEVNWVAANGGGTWVTELQLVDVSGGSTVRAYYSYGANRFGPITIWTNSGGANSSIRFGNILQTMDSLDPSAAVYSGTGGSLELVTQDGSHLIQAASRSYNGNGSCTFPALQDIETNTAAMGRSLVVPNISNNTTYRAKVMLVNTTSSSATIEVRIIGGTGSQVGGTINRTLAGYEMLPLVNEMRVDTYSNAAVRIDVTSGSGQVLASGQTSNNASNDPAAHLAVQTGSGFANSPASRLLFPEVNWVGANGGGMWVTELQLVDVSGGSTVQAYYSYGANRFGPITIWTNSGAANSSISFSNILQTMDSLDPSAAVYSGTGGSLELVTQDGSHLIQAASRSYNGNGSCTFPALQDVDDNTAAAGRSLLVPNISNNAAYRAKVMLVNSTSSSATIEVRVIGGNGSQVGSTISRTLAGYEMLPLVNELRVNTYSNATVRIDVTSGSGRIMASGQTSNNASNDPAAHIAVQAQ